MFTLKFYMGESYNMMSAKHYHITEMPSWTEVTVYNDFTTQHGTTYHVGKGEGNPFESVLIKDYSGNVIDRI